MEQGRKDKIGILYNYHTATCWLARLFEAGCGRRAGFDTFHCCDNHKALLERQKTAESMVSDLRLPQSVKVSGDGREVMAFTAAWWREMGAGVTDKTQLWPLFDKPRIRAVEMLGRLDVELRGMNTRVFHYRRSVGIMTNAVNDEATLSNEQVYFALSTLGELFYRCRSLECEAREVGLHLDLLSLATYINSCR
ncbi:MAG: hypothetical protein WCT32_04075 [Patescibacteria group bacterium]|jgi:hypothetical protein